MHTVSLNHLLEVATRAAEAAGNHALTNKHRRAETIATFDHDVKLALDVESQTKAEAVISAEFPDHAILGEESTTPNPDSDYEWIIDPIDGTMNFSHGFTYWCSSVAVRRAGQILAGCVYAPDEGHLYTAHIEEHAKRDGEAINVSRADALKKSLICTGLSKEIEVDPERYFSRFQHLTLGTKKLRIKGAAALDLCKVADGTADGFFEGSIYLWDYAAGALIVERAGGSTHVFEDERPIDSATVVASNPRIFDDLRSIYAN